MELRQYPQLGERIYWDTLPNGLTVAVVPRPGFTKKLAYFVTDFGSIHTRFTLDGQDYTVPDGVAHYLEHKLFELPGRDVTAEFAALGAVPNAFTSYDMTAYYFSCTEHFDENLKLLLEFVSTPCFTPESVAREQGIIGQEIDMNRDNPDTRLFENLMQAMYENHPITQPILGTRQSIGRITPQVLETCHRAFYRPGNMLLCVVGDVDPEKVGRIAAQMLPQGSEVQVTALRQWQEALTCKEQLVSDRMEVAMPIFQVGFKCRPLDQGEAAVRREIIGDLASEALFGESSPLYLRLYEEGLIDGSFGGGFETVEGMAMLSASGDSDAPEAVRDAILEEARRIVREGITQEDFLRMKRGAMGCRLRGLDSFDSVAFRICAYYFSGFDYFDFPRVYEQIQLWELQEFLRDTVTAEGMCMSIIYPAEQEAL